MRQQEKAFLAALRLPKQRRVDVDESLDELSRLAESAGARVVGRLTQERKAPSAALYFGKGKVEEIKTLSRREHADLMISDDLALLDRPLIHRFLSEGSYWAKNVPREVVDRSINHSLCFGIYEAGRQIGFARVVTDRATFAWLADVFVLEARRGRGLSKQLMAAVIAHPALQGLRRFMLATLDAHGLYQQFGFAAVKDVERFMEIHRANVYNYQQP